MRLGIFLDVDGVLTNTSVNMQIAAILGVAEKLRAIEDDFNSGRIGNDEFNRALVPMFGQAGFSLGWMRHHFDSIEMQVDLARLLDLCPDVHFVSSGPDYYLNLVADRYQIPRERICCSRYTVDRRGQLEACASPIDSAAKARFVRQRSASYLSTIGVGDSALRDGAFLSECRLPVLLGPESRSEFLSASDWPPLLRMISHVSTITGTLSVERTLESTEFPE